MSYDVRAAASYQYDMSMYVHYDTWSVVITWVGGTTLGTSAPVFMGIVATQRLVVIVCDGNGPTKIQAEPPEGILWATGNAVSDKRPPPIRYNIG